jgi:multiple sugar transport system permease protein
MKKKTRTLFSKAFISLWLAVIALVALLPLLFMIRTSFVPTLYYTSFQQFSGFTLDHYREVYLASDFPRYLQNSLLVTVLSTFLVIFIGSLAGYALARFNFRGRENFLFFVLSTRMGPPVAFAVPLFLLMLRLDLLDKIIGLMLAYLLYNLAFTVWMTQGFFAEVPVEVEESGMIDGLNRLGVLFRISYPLALPGLLATGIFVFITTWNEFFYAFVITRTVAKTWPTQMPAFAGYFQIAWGEIFAASVIAVLPALIFGILIRGFFARGLSLGAVR